MTALAQTWRKVTRRGGSGADDRSDRGGRRHDLDRRGTERRDRAERPARRVPPERGRSGRRREPRARVARRHRTPRGRRRARRAADQRRRARRHAQPRATPLRPAVLDRRQAPPRRARSAGRSGSPGRGARAEAGGRGAVARADRAGAQGRDADPAELPPARAARPSRLGGGGVLPARARGRRRLLRPLRAARRAGRGDHRRRHRQGRPGRDGDGRRQEPAPRLGPAGRLAGRGARARQRPPLPRHPGEDVRHLPLPRGRSDERVTSATRTRVTTCRTPARPTGRWSCAPRGCRSASSPA